MDRRGLEYFRAVADAGSISTAAMEMHVTQPAVSKQIARLESELGVQLFHRMPSGMVMTPAGETLLELGAGLLTKFERLESVIRARYLGRDSFRVACPHATADAILAPFIADTNAPIADLRIVTASEVDKSLDHEVDLAVSSIVPPNNRRRITITEIPIMIQCTEEAQAIFQPSGRGDLERLANEWVIVPGTGVGVAVKKAAESLEHPPLVREVSAGSIAQGLAANSHGFALVTESRRFGLGAIPAYSRGELVTITLYASWDIHHAASPELANVAQSLRAWMIQNPPWGDISAFRPRTGTR